MTQNPLINPNESTNRALMYTLGQENESNLANSEQSVANLHAYSHAGEI